MRVQKTELLPTWDGRVVDEGPNSRAWISRIVGTDGKGYFRREFCAKDIWPENVYFDINQPGLYEFRRFGLNRDRGGFAYIDKYGIIHEITREEVLSRIEKGELL